MTRASAINISGLLAVLSSFGGCNDPRYVDKAEIRRARVEQHVRQYREHDAAGPERIQQTLDIHRRQREHHKESLKNTADLARRLHERDVERWQTDSDLRRERINKYLHGKPERIADTWADMIY